jgi:hypothetical protein
MTRTTRLFALAALTLGIAAAGVGHTGAVADIAPTGKVLADTPWGPTPADNDCCDN